jgi:hypothetical protein
MVHMVRYKLLCGPHNPQKLTMHSAVLLTLPYEGGVGSHPVIKLTRSI